MILRLRPLGRPWPAIWPNVAADPRIAEILSIPRREPLLRTRQVIYSTKGQAIMYVLGFYRSDRHNLVIRRFR